MPEENTEVGVQSHLSNKRTWIRLPYMILFGIIFEIVKFAVFLVAAVQFLFKLFSGDVQPQIRTLGGSLAEYLRQIIEFLAFRTEDKPYPWGAWPMPDKAPAVDAGTPKPDNKPAAKTTVRSGARSRRRKSGDENKVE